MKLVDKIKEKFATKDSKTIKYNSVSKIEKVASKEDKISWYGVKDGDKVKIRKVKIAGKKPLDIIEDEVIIISGEVVSLQKLLGEQNKKLASLEARLDKLYSIISEGGNIKVAQDTTLKDVLLSEEEKEKQETPPAEATGEVAEPEKPEGEEVRTETDTTEEKPEEGKKEDVAGTEAVEEGKTISVDINKVVTDLKNLESVEDVDVKSVAYDPKSNEVIITLTGKPKSGGEFFASIHTASGVVKVAKDNPTNWVSKYKFDPVTFMLTPFPSSGEPNIMVEEDKKSKPEGEVRKTYVEDKKVSAPEGKTEILVEKPKKKASVEIQKLASEIVRKAVSKNLIDVNLRDVLYYNLIKKANEEELAELNKLVEVINPEEAFIDPESGEIVDLSKVKEIIE